MQTTSPSPNSATTDPAVVLDALYQFDAYVKIFPEEAKSLEALRLQFLDDAPMMFDRKNMRGHITASALTIDPVHDKVLVIDHLFLQRKLQPGGHAEGENLISVEAAREADEEAGTSGLVLHSWHTNTGAPLDIDTHDIPANPGKNEDPHVHHDFLYVYIGDSTKPLTPQKSEVKSVFWMPRTEFAQLPGQRFPRLVEKLALLRRSA